MTTYDAETPRLYLQRLTINHLASFHAIRSSKESMIWSTHLPMPNLEASQKLLEEGLNNPELDKFGIMLKRDYETKDGKELKMIGLIGTVREGDEIGYMLQCDYWRKGYMTEALNAFVGPKGLFWDLPNRKHIQAVLAAIDVENTASSKVIQKIGAKKGELRVKGYSLGRDRGPDGLVPEEKKRDMIFWKIDRPTKN